MMNPTMPPTRPHSRGVSAPRIRASRDAVAAMGFLLMFLQRQEPAQRIKTRPGRNSDKKPSATSGRWSPVGAYPSPMSSTVDELVAQLRDGGSRVTTARRLVLTALVKGAHHPTAEELLVVVRELAPDVHASTVYRNLEELERLGVVVHTHLGHGPATYHLATEAHGHLVCEVCGATMEAPQDLFEAMAEGAK